MSEPILTFNISPDEPKPPKMGVEHDGENVTVAEVLDWFEVHDPRHGGKSEECHREQVRVRALFRQTHGHLITEKCRPFMLVEFVNAQSGLKSNWSRRRWGTTIARPFAWAARMGFIRWNPFSGGCFETGEGGRDWQPSEYKALLARATQEFRRVLIFIRVSGMRPGEIMGLEWDEVDLEGKSITIPKEKTKAKRVRHVPINTTMAQILDWLKRDQAAGREPRLSQVTKRKTTTTHVFRNSHGGAWTTESLTKQMRKIRKDAGLSYAVKLHSGRHTFATAALMAGVDLFSLMNLLGHRDMATTKRYVHLANKCKFLQDAMERVVGGNALPSDIKQLSGPEPEPEPLTVDEQANRLSLDDLRKAAAEAQADFDDFLRGEGKEGAA